MPPYQSCHSERCRGGTCPARIAADEVGDDPHNPFRFLERQEVPTVLDDVESRIGNPRRRLFGIGPKTRHLSFTHHDNGRQGDLGEPIGYVPRSLDAVALGGEVLGAGEISGDRAGRLTDTRL